MASALAKCGEKRDRPTYAKQSWKGWHEVENASTLGSFPAPRGWAQDYSTDTPRVSSIMRQSNYFTCMHQTDFALSSLARTPHRHRRKPRVGTEPTVPAPNKRDTRRLGAVPWVAVSVINGDVRALFTATIRNAASKTIINPFRPVYIYPFFKDLLDKTSNIS